MLDYTFKSVYKNGYQLVLIDDGNISPVIYKFKRTDEAKRALADILNEAYIIYVLINEKDRTVYVGQSRQGSRRCFQHNEENDNRVWSTGYIITVKNRAYLDYIENKVKHHLDVGNFTVTTTNVNKFDLAEDDQTFANKYYINTLEQFISIDYDDVFSFDDNELQQQEKELEDKQTEIRRQRSTKDTWHFNIGTSQANCATLALTQNSINIKYNKKKDSWVIGIHKNNSLFDQFVARYVDRTRKEDAEYHQFDITRAEIERDFTDCPVKALDFLQEKGSAQPRDIANDIVTAGNACIGA